MFNFKKNRMVYIPTGKIENAGFDYDVTSFSNCVRVIATKGNERVVAFYNLKGLQSISAERKTEWDKVTYFIPMKNDEELWELFKCEH